MTEIRADQLALLITDLGAIEAKHMLDLVIAGHEHASCLPVPRLEILEHQLQFGTRLGGIERHHRAHDPLGAIAAIATPRQVERPHHNP